MNAKLRRFDLFFYRLLWRLLPGWMDRRQTRIEAEYDRKESLARQKKARTKLIVQQGLELAKKYRVSGQSQVF